MLLLIYVLNTYIVLCFRIEMDEGRGTLASYASWSGISARSGHPASPPVLPNPMSWPRRRHEQRVRLAAQHLRNCVCPEQQRRLRARARQPHQQRPRTSPSSNSPPSHGSTGPRRPGCGPRRGGSTPTLGEGMATASLSIRGTRASVGDGAVLEQKTVAALSRPCCWAAQDADEIECLGSAAPLDGTKRLPGAVTETKQRISFRLIDLGTKSSAVGDNDGAVQSANLSQAIRIQRQPCQNRIAGQFGRPIPAHTAHKQERPSPLPCASRSSRHPRTQMRSRARSASVLPPVRSAPSASLLLSQHRGVALLVATARTRRIRCAPVV